jgi:hypothetical protein
VTRFLIYILLVGSVLYLLSWWGQRNMIPKSPEPSAPAKPSRWFRPKKNPMEPWVQVYETGSMDEARVLQARLQEEEVECVLYEQGKKDIHGNALKGVGLAVPKTAMTLAQNIISRLLS